LQIVNILNIIEYLCLYRG